MFWYDCLASIAGYKVGWGECFHSELIATVVIEWWLIDTRYDYLEVAGVGCLRSQNRAKRSFDRLYLTFVMSP